MAEIDVIHLVWRDADLQLLRNFLESYQRHQAGEEHELVVLFNGFRDRDLERHRNLVRSVPHKELLTPEPMLDIAAYFWAGERSNARHLCFLNSYSTLLADDWLRKLMAAVRQPKVGAAGATGSWESVYTAYAKRMREVGPPRSLAGWLKHGYRRLKLGRYRAQFDPMPNPHLRSNAFVIERARWLGLKRPPLRTKWQTLQFENGKHSMSRQLVEAGLAIHVVDREGNAYPSERWPDSHTFRQGRQENLLVADNRTRQYDEAGDAARLEMRELAWGRRA